MTLFIPPDLIMLDFFQASPAQPNPAPNIVSVSAMLNPIFSSMTLTTLSFIYSSATRLC